MVCSEKVTSISQYRYVFLKKKPRGLCLTDLKAAQNFHSQESFLSGLGKSSVCRCFDRLFSLPRQHKPANACNAYTQNCRNNLSLFLAMRL